MIKIQKYALIAFMLLVPIAYHTGVGGGMDARIFEEAFYRVFGMCLVTLFIGNFWISSFFIWALDRDWETGA